MAQGTQIGALHQPGGEGDRRGFQREDTRKPMAESC